MVKVGIVSYGLYIPKTVQTAEDISAMYHIPLDVVREKQGLIIKHVSSRDEMPSDMAIRAARNALKKASREGMKKEDIGMILYVGSQWKDYHVWLMSTYIQDALGIGKAFSVDVSSMCTGMVFGLYLAKKILSSDRDIKAILLVGASKESYIVDPEDRSTNWMDNFADAGVAAVVARDWDKNVVLDSDFMSDGSLSFSVLQRGGGAKEPCYSGYCKKGVVYLEGLMDKEEMKSILNEKSVVNFKRVIERSIKKSGLDTSDLSKIFLNHMKPSFHHQILKSLRIVEGRSLYLDRFGHSQSADQFIALDQAIENEKFSGGYVVFAAAGTGYVWGSTVIRWG